MTDPQSTPPFVPEVGDDRLVWKCRCTDLRNSSWAGVLIRLAATEHCPWCKTRRDEFYVFDRGSGTVSVKPVAIEYAIKPTNQHGVTTWTVTCKLPGIPEFFYLNFPVQGPSWRREPCLFSARKVAVAILAKVGIADPGPREPEQPKPPEPKPFMPEIGAGGAWKCSCTPSSDYPWKHLNASHSPRCNHCKMNRDDHYVYDAATKRLQVRGQEPIKAAPQPPTLPLTLTAEVERDTCHSWIDLANSARCERYIGPAISAFADVIYQATLRVIVKRLRARAAGINEGHPTDALIERAAASWIEAGCK